MSANCYFLDNFVTSILDLLQRPFLTRLYLFLKDISNKLGLISDVINILSINNLTSYLQTWLGKSLFPSKHSRKWLYDPQCLHNVKHNKPIEWYTPMVFTVSNLSSNIPTSVSFGLFPFGSYGITLCKSVCKLQGNPLNQREIPADSMTSSS